MSQNYFETHRKEMANIGRCIYCGSTDDLREEHIIPFGLNGSWVLLNASCNRCADITSKFEMDVLRDTLLPVRAVLGFRTRRKKDRPKNLPIWRDKDSMDSKIDVPLSDYPAYLHLPVFKPPAFIEGRDYSCGIEMTGLQVKLVGPVRHEDINRKYDSREIVTYGNLKPPSFARLIAKIAYCLTVGQHGLENIEECFVLPAILGAVDDIGKWVGSAPDRQLYSIVQIHRARLDVGASSGIVFARISLFTAFDTVEYIVVVGRLSSLYMSTIHNSIPHSSPPP